MGGLAVVLLLCCFHAFASVGQTQQTTPPPGTEKPLSEKCRDEMYACTRMYSVHRPTKRCVGALCLYSLSRVYVINNEICTRIVCEQDEYMKAELCRELSGWPRRIERSTHRKLCRNRRGNPKSWANKARWHVKTD